MHLPPSSSLLPLVAWLAIGAIIGFAATGLARRGDGEGLPALIVVGVASALAAGAWFAPRLGLDAGHLPVYLLGALGACLFGAVLAAGATQFARSRSAGAPRHRHRRT